MAGAVNGHIKRFYDTVLKLEESLGLTVDWVLCVGSWGIFPDPRRTDKASKGRAGDFARMYLDQEPVPRPTVFVAGPHEDHLFLQECERRQDLNLLPNLTWLMNGYSTIIGDAEVTLDIIGLGKTYSPTGYRNGDPRHYTYQDVQRACSAGPSELFLCHEGVQGETYGNMRCEAEGVKKIIYATRPKLVVHGHFNYNKHFAALEEVPAYSLADGEILPFKYTKAGFKKIGMYYGQTTNAQETEESRAAT